MSLFNKKTTLVAAIALVFAGVVSAKVAPDQAARLGQDLTPVGGEKAGNADGSIPVWEGGITSTPAGYKSGDHHPDPFPGDAIKFSISAQNAEQYKDKLTPGQMALFKAYPTYKMNVYQTRRTASFPQRIYEATAANAPRAELTGDGNGMKGAAIGIPFPIPGNGQEVMWNHIMRYHGTHVARSGGQAAPTREGDFTLVKFRDQLDIPYAKEATTPETLDQTNRLFFFKQWVISPARLAGTALLVHEPMDQIKEPRQAWTYNTGQQRVRRAPNVAYDAPGTAADGLRTTDDFDMFNGALDRYDWKLVGKQELYVAYNNYKLHSDSVKYADIIKPGHINPDLVRNELHRVWVVEATLKSGARHQYKKRVFFVDEDSWQILVSDIYDDRDQLWRVAVAYAINYYEVPTLWTTLEVFHDLQSGRYLALGLDNEDEMYDFTTEFGADDFNPASLRREGTR
ncbi:MAG: DUF1329 domain-containing protein [Gammaproteobacteria bacterium]|nr:DUF1329 domain-containing protein [Gammaproteobacteria bacterium]